MRNNFIRTNIFSRSPQKVPKNKHRTFQNQLKWNKILDKEITKKWDIQMVAMKIKS